MAEVELVHRLQRAASRRQQVRPEMAGWASARNRTPSKLLRSLQSILKPRGRPPRSDDDYRRITLAYLSKLAERESENRDKRGILLDTAAELGMPRTMLKGWLWQAGRLGFLSGNTPGSRLDAIDKAGVMQANRLA